VSSPKRGEVSEVRKIRRRSVQENRGRRVAEESRRRRGTEKRGGMPKRPGVRTSLRGKYPSSYWIVPEAKLRFK